MGASQRFYGLDALRAFAMFMGIVLHASIAYMTPELRDLNSWFYFDSASSFIANQLFFTIHLFRMPVFFLLAGFFTAMMILHNGEVQMLKRRAAQLLPVLLFGWMLLVPLSFFIARYFYGVIESEVPAFIQYADIRELWLKGFNYFWFLHYLIIFLVVSSLCSKIPGVVNRLSMLGSYLLTGKKRWLLLPAILTILLLFMPTPIVITDSGFLPALYVLAYYFVFFLWGKWLFANQQMLLQYSRYPLRLLGTASGVFSLVGLLVYLQFTQPYPLLWQVLGSAVAAFSAVIFVESLLGLFQRWSNRPSAVIRKLSDSAYFVYIVHLPVVLLLQGLIAQWQCHAVLKLLWVSLAGALLSYLLYLMFVRGKFLEKLLDGRYWQSRRQAG